VSFVNAFNAVTTVLFEATVTDGSFTASIGLFTTTVAVAVSQLLGWHQLRIVRMGNAAVPRCLVQHLDYHLCINTQWPKVTAVTLVFDV
jgi:hypothetical protein